MKARGLFRGAVWALVASLLMVAGLVFLAGRSTSLQWAARQAVRFTDGRLQVDGLTGSALGEIAADTIRWQGEHGLFILTSPRFSYHPFALLKGLVRVEKISADDIQVELQPDGATAQPHRAVRLPPALSALPVVVERIQAGRVVVRRDRDELLRLHNLEAVVRHDGDRINARLLNLDVEAVLGVRPGAAGPGNEPGWGILADWGAATGLGVRGEVTVLSRAPYATDGRLLLQPATGTQPARAPPAATQSAGFQPIRVDVRISGPVQALSVRALTTVSGAPLEARTVFRPFDARPLRQVRLDLKDLDLSRHDPNLPVTRLSGSYEAEVLPAWANESKPLLIGPLSLVNAVAGPLDRGLVPLAAATAMVGYGGGRLEFREIQASGGAGDIAGEAAIGPDGLLRLGLAGENLLLPGIASTLAPRQVAARIAIEPPPAGAGGLILEVSASHDSLSAGMKGLLGGGRLQISEAHVQAGPGWPGLTGRAAFQGTVGMARPWPVDLSGNFRDLIPEALQSTGLPPVHLNGTWRLAGLAGAEDDGALQAEARVADSRLGGLPLAGRLAARVGIDRDGPRRMSSVEGALHWGSGSLEVTGALGDPSDALRLVLAMPKLGELQQGASGMVTARGTLRGALRSPALDATFEGTDLVAATGGLLTRTTAAVLEIKSGRPQGGAVDLHARLQGVEVVPAGPDGAASAARGLTFDRVSAALDGSAADHRADLSAVGQDWRIDLQAKGGIDTDGRWRGVVQELAASHPWLKLPGSTPVPADAGGAGVTAVGAQERQDLRLRAPFDVVAGAGRAGARGASFDLHGATLNVKHADWRDSMLTLSADASGLEGRWLFSGLARGGVLPALRTVDDDDAAAVAGASPVPDDLRLAGRIDFSGDLAEASAAGWRGRLELKREAGDLAFAGSGRGGAVPAGLTTLQASAALESRALQVQVDVDADHIGRMTGEAHALIGAGPDPLWSAASLAGTPLSGRIELATRSFRSISPLASGSWLVDGNLGARLQLAGTLGRPRLDGFVTGSNLSASAQTLGMRLNNGILAAEVDGGRVDVKVLRFESGEGSVAISGLLQAPVSGASEARLVIDRLPVTLGPGERVVLSGSAGAILGREALDITGHLAVDEASIQLREGDGRLGSELTSGSDEGRRLLVQDRAVDRTRTAAPRTLGAASERSLGSGSRRGFDAAGAGGMRVGLPVSGEMPGAGDALPRAAGAGAGAEAGAEAHGRIRAPSATSGLGPGAWDFSIGSDIEIDLGRNFRVSGSGLDANLTGAIRVRGTFPERPSAAGTVDLVGGTYLAMGRKLKLRRARVIFYGPLDEPALDIVAVRENSAVETGLVISGTAAAPAVRLVSAPEVGDADKLAWLILGTGLPDARRAGQLLVLRNAAATLFGDDDGGLGQTGIGQAGIGQAGIGQAGIGQAGIGQAGIGQAGPGQSGAGVRVDVQTVREQDGEAGSAPAGGADKRSQGTVAAIGRRLSSSLALTCEESLRGVWDILRLQSEITDRLSASAQAGSDRVGELLRSVAIE